MGAPILHTLEHSLRPLLVVYNSPREVEPVVLILASWLKVITSFFWPTQWVPRLSSAQTTLHIPEVKYAIKLIVWVAKGQKLGCAEAIINLNLICNFSNLSVSVCSVA